MYKVIAVFDAETREALFPTKFSADEFAFKIMGMWMSTCPIVEEVRDEKSDEKERT